MSSEHPRPGYPTSVYQTDRVSAYLALVFPLLPLYIVMGMAIVRFWDKWIFWVVAVPLVFVCTLAFYKCFDCSRSKKIELYSNERLIALYGFVYPLGFYDILPKKFVELQYSDIRGVKRTNKNGTTYFTVFTQVSKFRFMGHFDRSEELYRVLGSISVKNNHPQSESEKAYALMSRIYWIGLGAMFGIAILLILIAFVSELF